MSEQGRFNRGKKYNQMRNVDGTLMQGILESPAKLADLDFYIERTTKQPEPEIKHRGRKKKNE